MRDDGLGDHPEDVSPQIGIVDGDASGVDLAECQQMKLPDERVQMSRCLLMTDMSC